MHAPMARMARLVVPGIPHHVTQRGDGCAGTFYSDGDDALYRTSTGGPGVAFTYDALKIRGHNT